MDSNNTITPPTLEHLEKISFEQLYDQFNAIQHRLKFWRGRMWELASNTDKTFEDVNAAQEKVINLQKWLNRLRYEMDRRKLDDKISVDTLLELITTGAKFNYNFL